MNFDVIMDTREKIPWIFNHPSIRSVITRKLNTGDYSIEGIEDLLYIERKRSFLELYNNFNEPRFWRELERGKEFKYRFLIVECAATAPTFLEWDKSIPIRVRKNMKMSPKYLFNCISRMQVDYGVNVVFAQDTDHAVIYATNIMRRVYAIERS